MDVEEADNAILASSVSLNSTVSRQNGVFPSEDLAWVDSCLNNDFDIAESDWIPLRDALLEIISSESPSFSLDGGEDNESHPYSEEKNNTSELNQESSTSDAEHLQNRSSTYNVNLVRIAAETNTDDILEDESTETLSSSTFQGNPFLPTYNEDMKQNEPFDFDLGLNFDFAFDEMEQASEDIFKVWDLDIPSEEGELVKQLKKALSEAPSDSGKDLKEESLDDLIAGIADLSLNKKV